MAARTLPPIRIGDAARADFRTSKEADAANGILQRSFGFAFRYQPARLAMGRSLGVAGMPPPVADIAGKPIRGDILFGQDEVDIGLWISLVAEHAGRAGMTRKDLQEAVAAHWARGVLLLSRERGVDGLDAPSAFRTMLAR